MIFKSSEIRWFSKDKDLLWEVYENLPEKGEGTRESDRTDYYLKSGTISTGIKIREGNHELKVKCADDEDLGHGVMEHWIKWSTSEEVNILNTIDHEFLGDWIADTFPPEGCGAEFTEVCFPSKELTLYTFGMEAFSFTNRERENLMIATEVLDLDFSSFKEFNSYGYPQLLYNLGKDSE